jgi:hypothetical protein
MPSYDNLLIAGEEAVDDYYNKLTLNIDLTKNNNKNNNILQKEHTQTELLIDIKNKEKLLLTRSRMLQISTDRNSYKTKIIYSLIALAIAIFIISIVIYAMLSKKK